MSTASIRAKLHDYLDRTDDKTLRSIFSQLEPAITSSEWWNDCELVNELDCRSAELKSGKDPGKSWDEVKNSILKSKIN